MADSVFKLVVDSKEYDSKIRRAAEGLIYLKKNAYDTCRTLEVLEDDTIDFVKALGQMDTVASSASGALAEMKKAFMELSVQYKQLTDAERQSPYGKALASSLDQLKGRIKNMERDMRDAQRDMTGFGDAFRQLGAKLGIPTDIFAKFGPAVGGAAIALKVATDAFKQNKEMLDDWKSGVEVAQSTYQGFLNALNTGDIRGFLSRLGEISAAAREAYKALDKLGTFNAFNQINLQRAQTKYDETIANYREGNASKSDVRSAADAWKNELERRRDMEMDAYLAKIKEIAETRGVDAGLLTKALSGSYGDYESLKALTMPTKSVYNSSTRSFYDEIDWEGATEAQKLGHALRQLNDTELQSIQGLGRQAETTASEIANIDKRVARLLGKSQDGQAAKIDFKIGDWQNTPESGSIADLEQQAARVRNSMGGAINAEEYKEMEDHLNNILAKIKEIRGENNTELSIFEQREKRIQEITAAIGEMNNALATSDDANLKAWATEQIKQYNAELDKLNGKLPEVAKNAKTVWDNLSDGVGAFSSITGAMDGLKSSVEGLAEAFNGEMDAWDSLMAVFNSGISVLETVITLHESLNTLTELSTKLKDANAAAQQAETMQVVTGKSQEIVAENAETVASQVSTGVDTGEATAKAAKSVAGVPLLGPILAVAAIATVLGAIMAARSKGKSGFASGGIVPGNSFSGDNLHTADFGINSGELILNRSQQDSIAGQLTSGSPSINIVGKISGRDILLAADNSNASRGGRRGIYANVKV